MKGTTGAGGSEIFNSETTGVMLATTGAVKPSLRNTVVYNNGGYRGTSTISGGVAIQSGSDGDGGLDGSSNKGGNKINCNKHKPSGGSSTNADVYNASSKTIYFQGNNWGAATSNNPYSINAIINSGSTSNTDVLNPSTDTFGTSNLCTSR
jgi:hypothetical protein